MNLNYPPMSCFCSLNQQTYWHILLHPHISASKFLPITLQTGRNSQKTIEKAIPVPPLSISEDFIIPSPQIPKTLRI